MPGVRSPQAAVRRHRCPVPSVLVLILAPLSSLLALSLAAAAAQLPVA
jgi:hypothetical protein